MEKVYKSGQMVPNMKVCGEMAKLAVKVYLNMDMVINMLELSKWAWPMVLVPIHIAQVQNMKEIGNMICSMVKELKFGTMDRGIKVNITKATNRELVLSTGKMDLATQVNGAKTKSMVKEDMSGVTVDHMKENGKQT